MLAAWSFLLILVAVVAACRIGMVALHELGHALAALALQRGRVTVYLGSYGQQAGGGRLRLGRLRVYFRYNPLRLAAGGGLCQAQYPVGPSGQAWRGLLYVLAGPLLPLLAAALGLGLMLTCFAAATNVWKALPILFFGVALLSAIFNLLPRRHAIALASGKYTHNDGFQTKILLQHQHLARGLSAAESHFAAGRYAESARLYELLLGRLDLQAELFRRLISAHFHAGAYAPALTVSRQFQRALAAELTEDDLLMQAALCSLAHQYRLAVAAHSALLAQPVPVASSYNNRGYAYNLLEEYALAIPDFDQAIALDANTAFAYNNRGLARLRLGQPGESRADIEHSLQLDAANAYAHRNLGIWHFEHGAYPPALASLERAWQLDPTTPQLADYLQQTRRHLSQSLGTDG
jgi:tetratricopeptide (TPR) repeat protein